MKTLVVFLNVTLIVTASFAQPWIQNDAVFNPSGIPSLPFSQPRFADLDADGDFDMLLGSLDDPLLYFENTGSRTAPHFTAGADLFAVVGGLQAEMGVFYDLDADSDLDLITGGYLGLFLFENIGDSANANFVESAVNPFQNLSVGANPVPTLADVDADGDADLVVGLSEDGRLNFYQNIGTAVSPQFVESIVLGWFDVGLYAYPVLTDADNDQDFDLFCGRDATGFYFFLNSGDSANWQWQEQNGWFSGLASTTYWNSPALVDLNGDGKKDLVYGTAAGPLQYYTNTGSLSAPQWTASTNLFGGVLDVGGASAPCLFDFDYDGDLDLLSGSQLGNIKRYRNIGTAQSPAWQSGNGYFSSIDHSIYSSLSAADVNGDSLPDLIVGDLSGQFFFHRNTGNGFVEQSAVFSGIDLGWTSAPRWFDVNGDGKQDIIAGNEDGYLFYFENTGRPDSLAWQAVPGFFGTIDVGMNSVPAMGDIDNNGNNELLVGNLTGEVHLFVRQHGNWVEQPERITGVSTGQNAAPALGDLDGNGTLDIALGDYGGTFHYFKNDNATFVPLDGLSTPRDFQLLSVYPNPFNHRVQFSGNLPQSSALQVLIFDLQGRKVLSVNRPRQQSGRFRLSVDFPQFLPSGMYIYRLTTPGVTSSVRKVGKIIFLK